MATSTTSTVPGMPDIEDGNQEQAVKEWKMRRQLQSLDAVRGNGTSLISLLMRPKDRVSQVSKMLGDELGTASCIKSRATRQAVQTAITSILSKLKLYKRVPEMGLAIFCGCILLPDGRFKKINCDIEPLQPITRSTYLQLTADKAHGFIVVDGSGCLFGSVCGQTRSVLSQMTVSLPKKHSRGGQSATRFARLRVESRRNYLRKVAEEATRVFITDNKCNVEGMVLAGLADFKHQLNKSDLFDKRLQCCVLDVVDLAYGGMQGFHQAIANAAGALENVKYNKERKLLVRYFAEIAKDSGKASVGLADTMDALERGAVDTIIAWEDLPVYRVVTQDQPCSLRSDALPQEADAPAPRIHYADASGTPLPASTGGGGEPEQPLANSVADTHLLVEWLAENYADFGINIKIISNRSPEGAQFCMGFGGLGAILRHRVEYFVPTEEAPEHALEESLAHDGIDIEDYM